MTLIPAYGRDYKSKAAVTAAFLEEGRDFQVASGPDSGRYVSHSELDKGTKITIRYANLTKAVVLTC